MKAIVLRERSDYYTGRKYIHQGENFACVCHEDEKEKMKKYSSIKIANNACNNLNRKTDSHFYVEEIEL